MRVFWLRKGYYLSKSVGARLMTYFGFTLCLPLSTKKLKSILDSYHKKYIDCKGDGVVLLAGAWGYKKERHLYSTITTLTHVLFEGILMPVPENYHLFLSEQYGDYMALPPVESRRTHLAELDFGIYI